MGIISEIIDFYFPSKKDDLLSNLIMNKSVTDVALLNQIVTQKLLISNTDFLKLFKYRSLFLTKTLISHGYFSDKSFSTGIENFLFTAISVNDLEKISYALDLTNKFNYVNVAGENAVLYAAKKAFTAESLLNMLKLLRDNKFNLNFVSNNKENIFSIILNNVWYRTDSDYTLFRYIIENTKIRFIKDQQDFVPLVVYLSNFKIDTSLKKFIIDLLVSERNIGSFFKSLDLNPVRNIPSRDQWRVINKKCFNFFDIKTVDSFLLLFFGKKSKAYKRIFLKDFIIAGVIDYDFLIAASCLKDFVSDDNHFIEFTTNGKTAIKESNFLQHLNSLDYDNIKLLDGMVHDLGVKRFFSFFIMVNFHPYYYSDIMYMYNRIQSVGGLIHFAWKRTSSLIELHEKMQKEIQKFKSEEFKLNQTNIDYLDGLEFNSVYKYYVPKTNIELIECGLSLNFCLGNGSYAKEVFNSKIKRIIFLIKNDKCEGAIYFNLETLHIIESKIRNNKRMDIGFVNFIEKEITKHYQKNNIKVKPHKTDQISIISGFFI
jgi:hypothetical protein